MKYVSVQQVTIPHRRETAELDVEQRHIDVFATPATPGLGPISVWPGPAFGNSQLRINRRVEAVSLEPWRFR